MKKLIPAERKTIRFVAICKQVMPYREENLAGSQIQSWFFLQNLFRFPNYFGWKLPFLVFRKTGKGWYIII